MTNLMNSCGSRFRQFFSANYILGVLFFFSFIVSPVICPALTAQDKIKFKNLTISEGLSQNSVFSVLQDKKGLMWFGTWDGLNRYDGYEFTIYKYNEKDPYSISNNEIRALYEDSKGDLWIGTMEGLNRFDRGKERFVRFRHDPGHLDSLTGNRIHTITEDSNAALWIGTQDGGLSRFDRVTQRFFNYQTNPDNPNSLSHNDVRAICVDKAGILWIGTWGGGLNRFDPDTNHFTSYKNDPDDPRSLSDNYIRTVYEDRSGVLWIGTKDGGLSRFDNETQKFINYRPDKKKPFSLSAKEVISIYETRAGELWIGTRGGGLNKFDRKNQRFIQYKPIRGNNIWSLYEDKSGILWIGTSEGGVNKYLPRHKNFIHYKHHLNDPASLSGNDVWAIYKDKKKNLWVGVWDHGLNRLDPDTGKFTHYMPDPENPSSLSGNDVIAIVEDHNNKMWIGTAEGGVNKFDGQTNNFTHYKNDPRDPESLAHNYVFSIIEDNNNTLWMGGYLGRSLSRFNRESKTFTNYTHNPDNPDSIANHKVRKLFEDSKGNFWMTTGGGGLGRFHRKTEKFKYYTHDSKNPKAISGNNVTVLFEDSQNRLWVGVWGGGLDKFDPKTETFSHFKESDGLPSNSVMGILEDENGNLWISTFRGLSKFNPDNQTFTNYTPDDGLQGWEFNSTVAFKGKDGQMFFGGVNGFNAFYPAQIEDNPYIPPVILTDFKVFNQSVPISDKSIIRKSIMELNEITLSYKETVFTLEFAALNYIFPQKNQYAYKMEGFDKEWRHVGSKRRFATYTNLDPGSYQFRVKGANNDGLWNEEETVLSIVITPPWWKTIGFIFLMAILVISGLFAGYRWRIKSFEWKKQELVKEVDSQTKELKESNRKLEKLRQELENRVEQRTVDFKTSEGRLIALLDSTDDQIGIKDTKGKLIGWNKAYDRSLRKTFGVGAHVGMHTENYVKNNNPDLVEHHHQLFNRILKGEKIFEEFEYKIPGEGINYFEIAYSPVWKENEVIGVAEFIRNLTEQKHAEKKLKEAEQRYRTVADFTYDWEYWENPDGKLIYVSPSCERITGYSAAMFVENPDLMHQIILQEDKGIWEEHLHTVGPESGPMEIEFRICTKDNDIKWVEHICHPVHLEEEEYLGTRASNRDITLRKRTDEILVKSREFNRAILRSMKDHIAVLDKKGNILSVNESWLNFASKNDVTSLELVGEGVNYLDICRSVPENSDQTARETLDGIMQILNGSKEFFELDYPCHSPHEQHWFSMKLIPFKGEKGGVIVAHTDITARIKADEELKRKDKLLEDAQRTAHLGSWNWDTITNELVWSDEVYRIFGFLPQEFSANYETFIELVHPDDRYKVQDAVDQALINPSFEYNIVHRILVQNGSERIVRERGSVTFEENDKPLRMIGTIQDITEIRTMGAEVHKTRMEISHMDRVGTMAVLSAGLSHEINQPLGAILNNAQAALRFLANDQPDLKEVNKALQDIVSDDKRAGEIVHSIRNLMRNADQKRGEINFNETAREVILLIKSDMLKQNISLSKDLQSDMPPVFGSRVQIQQVILNLLMNALDAVTKNTVKSRNIMISTQFNENDGVLLSVSDSGPGIKTEDLEAVFESFQTTKKKGLGIGLSICRTIAQEHQGTIWAENRQQGGAVFYFQLPANGNQHG